MRRRSRCILAEAACLLLGGAVLFSGCYAGAAGIILGALALSDTGGSGNAPSLVGDIAVDGTRASPGSISFTLSDPESDPADVELSCLREGGNPIAIAGLRGLSSSPSGTRHRVPWDFASSLGAGFHGGVTVSIGVVGGMKASAGPMGIGNDKPEILLPAPLSQEGDAVVGIARIPLTVRDSSDDLVSVLAEYRTAAGEWRIATAGGKSRAACAVALGEDRSAWNCPECLAFPDVKASAGGTPLTFFWDVVEDLGQVRADVEIRATPFDGDLLGDPVTFAPFVVDNNTDPVVQMMDIAGSPDRSFEIPVRFLVRDAENDTVAVVLQWAAGVDPFPELPEDPTELKALVAEPLDEGTAARRKDLQILTETSRAFRGKVEAPAFTIGEDQVLSGDFGRAGLVFVPPAQTAPRRFPDPPFAEGSDVFLIGQEIRFLEGPGAWGPWLRIESFDPRTSVATLDGPAGAPPGTTFEVRAKEDMANLSSSSDGVLHTLLWDSLEDLTSSGKALESRIRLRAVPVDSEKGDLSQEVAFEIEDGPLVGLGVLTSGQSVVGMAIGDVAKDGRDDIAVIASDGSLDLFDQSAEWAELPAVPKTIVLDGSPTIGSDKHGVITIGDVDGDGTEEVLVATKKSSQYSLLAYSYANGSLGIRGRVELGESEPGAAAIGRLRDDGVGGQAVAVVKSSWGNKGVSVLQAIGEADGTLRFEERWSAGLDVIPHAVAWGDVNGDGHADLLVAEYNNTGTANPQLAVFFQDPGGDFAFGKPPEHRAPDRMLATDEGPCAIALGRLNCLECDPRLGNCPLDVLVVNYNSNTAGVYFGTDGGPGRETDGRGWYLPDLVLATGANPCTATVANLDGDGLDDVAVGSRFWHAAQLFLQRPGKGLSAIPMQTFLGPAETIAVGKGDLNGDGRMDLAVASEAGSVQVFAQCRPGGLMIDRPESLAAASAYSYDLVGADVNSDGRTDLLAAHQNSGTIGIYRQGFSGELTTPPEGVLRTGPKPRSVAVGDLDGDGRNDVVAGVAGSAELPIYLQGPSGDLGLLGTGDVRVPNRSIPMEAPAESVAIGDLDGDGRLDIAVTISALGHLAVLLPDAPGSFRISQTLQTEMGDVKTPLYNSLQIGDLDGDGRNDIAVCSKYTGLIRIHRRFPSKPDIVLFGDIAERPNMGAMAIGDMDGDGVEDLIVARWQGGQKGGIYFQDGKGKLELQDLESDIGVAYDRVAIGDLDGDGSPDIVFHGRNEPGRLYLNLGDRNFLRRRINSSGENSSIAVGDFDGDGRMELVIAKTQSIFLTVYRAR